MTNPPPEIKVVNRWGISFRAYYTTINRGIEHQYRVIIPGMEVSMVCLWVHENQLRRHLAHRKPIKVDECKNQ